ncbi:MAG: hypothetical protein U1F36_07780 [Planctomycetota bacterium]
MNQLEIPPISLARYVDLLKRRRWQVIPTTLAGLLVGAIVALVIPRYYVAKTTITYRGGALDKARGTISDPLFAKVSNAKLTIPLTLEKTLEALNLIGTNTNDPDRQAMIGDWTSRVDVTSFSFEQGQSYYNIEITVRDRDGPLSALVANRLRLDWIGTVMHDLEIEANQALASLSAQIAQQQQASDSRAQELENLRAQYGFQPDKPLELLKDDKRHWLDEDRRANAKEIEDLNSSIAEATARLAALKDELAEIKQSVPITEAAVKRSPEMERQISSLITQIESLKLGIDSLVSTKMKQASEQQLKSLQDRLDVLVGTAEGGKQPMVDNPEWKIRKDEQDKLSRRLDQDKQRLERALRKQADLKEDASTLNEAFTQYETVLEARAAVDAKKLALENERTEQELRADRARRGRPFEEVVAQPPSTPTEPGFLLVALAGSIVGLGAAIGFVLLADFLRATFKTVDDVGYALGVPILGVMAHLETAEQRARTVRQRRRITLIAAVFVVMSLGLVTVYYTNRTSLPTWVIQLLDHVLGADSKPK